LQELLTGYPPKLLEAADATVLEGVVRSGDTCIVRADATATTTATATPTLSASAAFQVGEVVIYLPEGVPATVASVHTDDSPPYYTIKMSGGREKQTVGAKLAALDDSGGAAEGKRQKVATSSSPAPPLASSSSSPTTTGAEVQKMPDDNSCLFHAVLFALEPPGASTPADLRATVRRACVCLHVFA
jgi:hypothetical protein